MELVKLSKVAFASEYAFMVKAQFFHWNVEGANFPQYHEFLGNLWEETFGAVDPLAEHIRTLEAYAPASLSRYMELSIVKDELNIPSAMSMMVTLKDDNAAIIDLLTTTQALAEKYKKMGIANFLQDRMAAHEKHGWQLRSIIKS